MIEVFADVCCPFTHVGLRRLVEHRSALGRDDQRIVVRSWPLELVNDAPLSAGLVAEEVAELRAQVAGDLFTGFKVDAFPSTSMPALELAVAAYDVGIEAGERVSLGLRTALFEEGADISAREVLHAIADSAGMGWPPSSSMRQRVVDDWHEGRERGVEGSPHFFVDGSGFFCPSLDIARVDGHLRIRSDPAALDEFLGRCFVG